MAETEVKKFSFWNFMQKNPLVYYPILVICINSVVTIMVTIFFDIDPLAKDISRMIMWTAFGFQWVGIVRSRGKNKIKRMKSDKDLLQTYAEMSQFIGEPMMKFLVPYHGKFMSRMWNKMRGRTILSLYATKKMGGLESYTKFSATKKEMFELKLKGYINTDDSVLALKGLKCLSKGKKLDITL